MVHIDLEKVEEKERKNKIYFQSLQPTVDQDIYDIICFYGKIRFKQKKPKWDAKGAIDGFWVEEHLRCLWFYPNFTEGFVFYDIGAAHGQWSLPALALGLKVIAFEPDPRYNESMVDSVRLSPNWQKMSLFRLGAYSNNGTGNFFELQEFQYARIDDFVKLNKIPPSYIKFDIEGSEYHAIYGAQKTIDLFKPLVFLESHYGSNDSEKTKDYIHLFLTNFFTELGYEWKMVARQQYTAHYFFYHPDGVPFNDNPDPYHIWP